MYETLQQVFEKLTFTGHAISSQVVANSAGAATGVLRSGETELWASSVVCLARVSSWMLSTASKRQTVRYHKCMWVVCVFLCVCPCLCVADLPFWPSLSYTFMWTTPLVLFLSMTTLRPSLLVTVPSCPDSSSAHHSLPPVIINVTFLKSGHRCKLLDSSNTATFCLLDWET